jgi:hypothetical protein
MLELILQWLAQIITIIILGVALPVFTITITIALTIMIRDIESPQILYLWKKNTIT